MKKLAAMMLMCVAMQAGALELDGAKFEDKAQVGNAQLVLNGAGIRSAIFWDIYAAGLYLTEKKHTAAAVMADTGAKRLELVVMKENDTKHFLKSLRKDIGKNYDEKQFAAFGARLDALDKMFAGIDDLKKGKVIDFDWVPGEGTQVRFDGKDFGRIEGADFYQALLSIWIGKEPAKDSLKKELLGA